MGQLQGRRILLGIGGGIAAYKSAELARRLLAAGAVVRVVMTPAATRFITPLTLQALTGESVRWRLFDPQDEAAMGHIELARWADAILIAPATADLIARLRLGLADDLLTTLCLASEAPLALAPAMNRVMWQQPVIQQHIAALQQRGILLYGPAVGAQACGEEGAGRMLEPVELVAALEQQLHCGSALDGVRVIITAGPTQEPLDPVRFLGNRSSGKMGFALAQAAAQQGAAVTLISGPVALPTPRRVVRIDVTSAQEMEQAVNAAIQHCDLFIASAAVADFRPASHSEQKIKKGESDRMTLQLLRNPDILAEVAVRPTPPFTVGFAAETEALLAHAEAKRIAKRADMIAANLVGGPVGGFGSEENRVTLLWSGGQQEFPLMHKQALAHQLLQTIAQHYRQARIKSDAIY